MRRRGRLKLIGVCRVAFQSVILNLSRTMRKVINVASQNIEVTVPVPGSIAYE